VKEVAKLLSYMLQIYFSQMNTTLIFSIKLEENMLYGKYQDHIYTSMFHPRPCFID
jgi:hypothetical protein